MYAFTGEREDGFKAKYKQGIGKGLFHWIAGEKGDEGDETDLELDLDCRWEGGTE